MGGGGGEIILSIALSLPSSEIGPVLFKSMPAPIQNSTAGASALVLRQTVDAVARIIFVSVPWL